MGLLDYITDVAIPSLTAYHLDKNDKLPYDYYTAPWEAEADKYGGVNSADRVTFDPWTEADGYYTFKDLISAIFS